MRTRPPNIFAPVLPLALVTVLAASGCVHGTYYEQMQRTLDDRLQKDKPTGFLVDAEASEVSVPLHKDEDDGFAEQARSALVDTLAKRQGPNPAAARVRVQATLVDARAVFFFPVALPTLLAYFAVPAGWASSEATVELETRGRRVTGHGSGTCPSILYETTHTDLCAQGNAIANALNDAIEKVHSGEAGQEVK